jgi:hypothetical protein
MPFSHSLLTGPDFFLAVPSPLTRFLLRPLERVLAMSVYALWPVAHMDTHWNAPRPSRPSPDLGDAPLEVCARNR